MITPNITGQWTGVLIYGKSYRQHAGKELLFEMDLVQQGESISGTSHDISGVGLNPDPAKISGSFCNNRIYFIKQYSSNHFGYYNSDKVIIDKSKPGPKIKYTGIINEDGSFKGEYTIKALYLLFWFIPFRVKNTGTWSMKRK